jgi:hypothetical protein
MKTGIWDCLMFNLYQLSCNQTEETSQIHYLESVRPDILDGDSELSGLGLI